MLSRALIALLHLYKVALSPLLGPRCRFYPSCSSYAIAAIKTHGAIRGSALAIGRLLRCHPWHPGGYDPVPESKPLRSHRTCSHQTGCHQPHSDLRNQP